MQRIQASVTVQLALVACLGALAGGCKSTPIDSGDGGDGGSTPGGSDGGGGDAAPTCALDAIYRFGNNGGLAFITDEGALSPPANYSYTRTFRTGDPTGIFCAPALPACDDPAHIDVADIMRDIANADVQAALAMTTPPIYGNDSRPVDGTVFRLLRADGRGFDAGPDCVVDGGGQFCHGPVPAGIKRLVADLRALDEQQLADAACATLRAASN